MLSEQETQSLLNEFPLNIKLSYENIIHKKVYNADINMAIPCGIKSFLWFTVLNNKNICILIEKNNNKMSVKNVCFSSELSFGTILFGTFLVIHDREYFTVEDILLYKSKSVKQDKWGDKYKTIKNILENETKQINYHSTFLTLALPLLSDNIHELLELIKYENYEIDVIQFRMWNRTNNYLYMKHIKHTLTLKQPLLKTTERIFTVKPTTVNDIYELYFIDNSGNEKYHDIACIPSYASSVMMNKLFRNIKENDNLDTLEESDDESEFENTTETKFVFMDKKIDMHCSFHPKFKKWVPIKIVELFY
jgi:hypothetical protein